MENINTLKANLSAIGDAIRAKLAVENKYRIEDMPAAINSISASAEPCIVTGDTLVGCINDNDTSSHNDWDKIKNLIDYENAIYLKSMFFDRKDLEAREVEEFFSHSMPNLKSLVSLAQYTIFSDSDINTHVFDLTLDSPNCTTYNQMFFDSNICYLKLTIPEHNVDFTINDLGCISSLRSLEITGPGLNNLTSLYELCYGDRILLEAIIGDDNTNYSKVSTTRDMFDGCSNLKTLTIKGVNVLPLTSTNAIPSTIQSIKVPAALVDTYKNSTNWSTFASKISAI